MRYDQDIDILENSLRRRGNLLDILLTDRTTGKNIIWATDSYQNYGENFSPSDQILKEKISGSFGILIQPRAAKSQAEQKQRTKDKAEVFTPLRIVKKINKHVDWQDKEIIESTWKDYVKELKLEISCGEAPFIVSRYDPVAHGTLIPIKRRVGFLDRKLSVISKYCHESRSWLKWARIAFQSSYGYEWQGDNILIARENLLYTLIDYYKDKFQKEPLLSTLKSFAKIISWNIFQMDGLRYVIPMSCHNEPKNVQVNMPLFDEKPSIIKGYQCIGCQLNNPETHNGKYVKIMDWSTNETIKFIDISHSRY